MENLTLPQKRRCFFGWKNRMVFCKELVYWIWKLFFTAIVSGMMPRIFASILLALATQSSSHLLEDESRCATFCSRIFLRFGVGGLLQLKGGRVFFLKTWNSTSVRVPKACFVFEIVFSFADCSCKLGLVVTYSLNLEVFFQLWTVEVVLLRTSDCSV